MNSKQENTHGKSSSTASKLVFLGIGLILGLIATVIIYKFILEGAGSSSPGMQSTEAEPLYWVAPMDPNFKRDKPKVFNKISKTLRNNVTSEIYFGISKYYIFEGKRLLSIINLLKAFIVKPYHVHFKHRFFILMLLFSIKLDKIKLKLFI